ncbi:MAG: hypothetical protein JXR40_08295 [Pontiellaceae bacterium]|nr:hypothetical protein [Pontiellaceae bacterium]
MQITNKYVLFLLLLVGFLSRQSLASIGGSFVLNGVHYVWGGPEGVLPAELSPETIKSEHIEALLEDFSDSVREGNLSNDVQSVYGGTSYVLSYVDDKRFSGGIYNRYAKPLFDTYGMQESEVVLLYYRTGGSMNALRKIYNTCTNERVKAAVEYCCFDAEAPAVTHNGFLSSKNVKADLSIEASCQLINSKTSVFDTAVVKENMDLYEIVVDFRNRGTAPIRVDIPLDSGKFCGTALHLQRSDGAQVLNMHTCFNHTIQPIWLYPGDCFTKKIFLHLGVEERPLYINTLFANFGDPKVVYLGDFMVSSRIDKTFTINAQVAFDYFMVEPDRDIEEKLVRKTLCSNAISFSYSPSKETSLRHFSIEEKRAAEWQSIRKAYEKATTDALNMHPDTD